MLLKEGNLIYFNDLYLLNYESLRRDLAIRQGLDFSLIVRPFERQSEFFKVTITLKQKLFTLSLIWQIRYLRLQNFQAPCEVRSQGKSVRTTDFQPMGLRLEQGSDLVTNHQTRYSVIKLYEQVRFDSPEKRAWQWQRNLVGMKHHASIRIQCPRFRVCYP